MAFTRDWYMRKRLNNLRITGKASENRSSKQLSRFISRSLILDGRGRYTTELAKNETLVQEHFHREFYCPAYAFQLFKGGSSAEGTMTQGSDIDEMLVVSDILVKTSEVNKGESERECDVFLLDTSESNPGYARLRLLVKSHKESSFFDGFNVNLQDQLKETKEGIFLRSETIVSSFVEHLNEKDLTTKSFQHGPCLTVKHAIPPGFLNGIPDISIERDRAFAIPCCEWPDEAKGWITRKRPHDWPPLSLVERISKKTCYVVPVGNPQSEHYDLEWRVSYLLSERELVWSFNDTQKHCFVLLKRFLKHVLETIAPDQLSSYHMKTLMFWVSEEKGLSMWYAENLITCLEECLQKLYDCLKQNKLWHYFNCQANLFGHKFENVFQKKQLLEKILEIRTNISPYLLACLSLNCDWPWLWFPTKGDFTKLRSCTDYNRLETNFMFHKQKVEAIHHYRSILSLLVEFTSDWKGIQNLQNLVSDRNQLTNVNFEFEFMTKHFLFFRFAMAYFRQITIHDDGAFQTFIDSNSITSAYIEKLILCCQIFDTISYELYLATVYHCLRDYDLSSKTVNELFKKRMHLVYPGYCSTYTTIHLRGGKFSKQDNSIIILNTDGRTYPAYDVIFSYKDIYCVPYPLKFECALSEFEYSDKMFNVHPCVYAYFLLCYGHFLTKDFACFRNTLVYLEKAVNETKGGYFRHHALNILSYCYVLDGNLQKAFEYFTESFLLTEKMVNVWNAAAIHIAILVMKRIDDY